MLVNLFVQSRFKNSHTKVQLNKTEKIHYYKRKKQRKISGKIEFIIFSLSLTGNPIGLLLLTLSRSLDSWLILWQFSMYFLNICLYVNTWNGMYFVLGPRGFKLNLKVHATTWHFVKKKCQNLREIHYSLFFFFLLCQPFVHLVKLHFPRNLTPRNSKLKC